MDAVKENTMSGEKTFVDALIRSARNKWPGCVVLRAADQFTLGIPDLLIWRKGLKENIAVTYAIEAKQLNPLMKDPYHKGRRTGSMLKHPFRGPQISMMRNLSSNGCRSYGIVRVSDDTAIKIHPDKIPKEGNFVYEQLFDGTLGMLFQREAGIWRFW